MGKSGISLKTKNLIKTCVVYSFAVFFRFKNFEEIFADLKIATFGLA